MSEPDKPAAPVNFVAEVTNQVPGPSCKLCGAAMYPTFHCDSCGSISGCTGPNDVRVGAASAQRHEIELVQRIAIRLSEMGFAFRADHSTMQVSIDPVEEATLSSAEVRELRTEVERTKGFDAVLMETVKLQAIVEVGDKENEVLCNRVQELREALNLALGKLEVADASPMYGSEVDEGIRDAKKIIEAALARVKEANDA